MRIAQVWISLLVFRVLVVMRSLSLYLSLSFSLSLSLSLSLLRKNWTMIYIYLSFTCSFSLCLLSLSLLLLLLSLSLVGKAQLRLQMRCLFHLSTKGLLIWVWYVLTWLELSAAVVSISCELLRCYYKFSAAPAAACCQKKEKAVSCHCVLTLLLPAQG